MKLACPCRSAVYMVGPPQSGERSHGAPSLQPRLVLLLHPIAVASLSKHPAWTCPCMLQTVGSMTKVAIAIPGTVMSRVPGVPGTSFQKDTELASSHIPHHPLKSDRDASGYFNPPPISMTGKMHGLSPTASSKPVRDAGPPFHTVQRDGKGPGQPNCGKRGNSTKLSPTPQPWLCTHGLEAGCRHSQKV